MQRLAAVLLAGVLAPASAPAADATAMLRVATFNASLNRAAEGELRRGLATPDDPQARAVAGIIQHVRPDILLLQEFDYDAEGAAVAAFKANYLEKPQGSQAPIRFDYHYVVESNTGVPSGADLDNDGRVGGGEDALGYGDFPGQYSMVVLSRFPLETDKARTFRRFLWRDMPGALLPDDPATPAARDWYSDEELALLPLSSKNHVDLPVVVAGRRIHLMVSHPTPPTFDGPEDRNGLRNHDEIRFWLDYITPKRGAYLRDDAGRAGGLGRRDAFIIMGDLNSDPVDGESRHEMIRRLLASKRLDSRFVPSSAGAVEASAAQGGANLRHQGDPRFDTADFNDRRAGNLRADYLLPSRGLRVCGGGVFWPAMTDPLAPLVRGEPPASDHRLVWLDLTAGGVRCPPGNDPTASAAARPRD